MFNYKNYKIIFLFISIYILTGCVTNPSQESVEPLSYLQNFKTKIRSTRVIVGLDPKNNENLQIHYGSSAQTAGLVGMLVESMIANSIDSSVKSREAILTPIRSAAIKFNFGSKLRSEVEKKLSTVSWLNVNSVKKSPSFQRNNIDTIVQETSQDIALIIDAHYNMAEDFSSLTASAIVEAYPVNSELTTLAKQQTKSLDIPAIYRNKFSYTYKLEETYSGSEEAGMHWSKDNGARVQIALQTAIDNITRSMIADLNKGTPAYASAMK